MPDAGAILAIAFVGGRIVSLIKGKDDNDNSE